MSLLEEAVFDECCRDNPCPHLGNIVTIKLSENQENVPQTDNTYLTMIVETHFQVLALLYLIENHVQAIHISFWEQVSPHNQSRILILL